MKSDIICLSKFDTGLIREEWYDAKTRQSQKRAKQLQDLGWQVDVSNIGSQMTPAGKKRVIQLTIRKRRENVDGSGDWERTDDIPQPEMFLKINTLSITRQLVKE